MDKQEYIASGIIEVYALGMATPQEAAEFENMCRKHPEIKAALRAFEEELEKKAMDEAVPPPHSLKEKVLDDIGEESAVNMVQEILQSSPSPPARVRKLPTMRWAIAICIALTLGFIAFIFIIYSKNQELKTDLARRQEIIDQLNAEKKIQEEHELPGNTVERQVKVFTPQKIPATINVFWDSTNTNVYLVILDLPQLSAGEKYQLWSVTNGKQHSLGLFDAPSNDRLILKINNAQKSDAFAISIVKAIPVPDGDSIKAE